MTTENNLREVICEVGRRMYDKNFGGSNDGNISARIDEEHLLITPAGASKGFLKPDELLVIDMKGNVVFGEGRPSSETKMHLQVYQSRKDVQAVCHAHPQKTTAYAVSRKLFGNLALPEMVFAIGNIVLTEYATPTTCQVPQSIEKSIIDADAVLLANHGAMTIGKDVMEAYFKMEALEHAASILFYAHLLGGAVPLTTSQIEELEEVKREFYS